MIVKVPEKRKDGRSSFADLINYVIERDGDSNAPKNSRNRRRIERILREAIENLRNAEKYLRNFRRTDTIDASAIRTSFGNFGKIAHSFEWSGQRHPSGVGNSFEQGVNDGFEAIIRNIQSNLRSAGTNLRQTGRIEAALQNRINACRADIARNAESIGDKSYGDKSIIGFGLDEEQYVMTSSGVPCLTNCLTLETAFAEMTAVASQNVRTKNPVYHFLISWPSEEDPDNDVIFDCAKYAQHSIGMSGHQFVYAIHRDTDNVHVHVAVNRVHPETYKTVFPKKDYFVLHKAMRELELKYGFVRDNGLYTFNNEKGKIEPNFPKEEGRIPQKAADMERFAGLESLYTYVRGEPRKAVVAALKNNKLDWEGLHRVLQKYDLEIKEKGRGFAIYSVSSPQTTPIKASDMHELLSKSRLIERLGNFTKMSSLSFEKQVNVYHPYKEIKRDPAEREARRLERAERRKQLKSDYDDYKKNFVIRRISSDEVTARYSVIRHNASIWREQVRENEPNHLVRKAMYSIIAFEKLRQKERLKIELAKERLALKQDPNNKPLTYKEWVAARAASGNTAAISQMRGFAYHERRKQHQEELIKQNGLKINASSLGVIDPIIPPALKNYKILPNGSVARFGSEGITLTDLGEFIHCNNSQRAFSLLDALKVAESKIQETSGHIQITGSGLFKYQVYELIALYQLDQIALMLTKEQQDELEKVRSRQRIVQKQKSPIKGQHGPFRQ